MALVLDATTTKTHATSITSTSWLHTCTGDDRVLIVGIACQSGTAPTVKYEGVDMDLVASSPVAIDRQSHLYELINPDSGLNTIAVTNIPSGFFGAYGQSLTGADQTSPTGTPATNSGNNTSPTVDVGSNVDEIVFDIVCVKSPSTPPTASAGAGQTEILKFLPSFLQALGSYETGAGTTTMSWGLSASREWANCAVAIKPVLGIQQAVFFT